MVFLGIDLGTSALKAILVDESQAVLAETSQPLETRSPRPGWFEQDPLDWWEALQQSVARLRALRPDAFGKVRAIGLSGQMHGAVLVDEAGEAIRPAILWNDGRAVQGMRCPPGGCAAAAVDRRHFRDARLHRPETPVARQARAGGPSSASLRCSRPRTICGFA